MFSMIGRMTAASPARGLPSCAPAAFFAASAALVRAEMSARSFSAACTKHSTPWMFLAALPKFDDDVLGAVRAE